MLRNRLWYGLKPWLPRPWRMGLRRWYTRRVWRRSPHVWPILPGSERPPEGWPGWPRAHQFAFVLTHDVEGREGLARCRRLMELEQQLGFRSSFNFIPEGEYRVSPELRAELARNGFEVGVHDLHHDGHLFDRREGFAQAAPQINHYLREWQAVGFRAGFMLRRLDWLHDLELLYDASTFDTDPFEPQPEGMGTIFPFWVNGPNSNAADNSSGPRPQTAASPGRSTDDHGGEGVPPPPRGFVELPYTLVQDSTLFLLLGADSPELWLRKLDWIAAHGGMALVNVHPDYVRFPDEPPRAYTFPVEHYRRLLEYVREKYDGRYWQALPREVATYVRTLTPLPRYRRPLRVAMVTHSVYQTDTRIIQYAETLAARGDRVEVFSLRAGRDLPLHECLRDVRVYPLHDRFRANERGLFTHVRSVGVFLCKAAVQLACRHRREPYDLIHVHNVPDFLVLAAAYPRWRGARVILDIHDILPEFYASKFRASEKSFALRLLRCLERAAARWADHVLIANDLWRARYEARTGCAGKCSVLINHVNLEIFHPGLVTDRNGHTGPVLMFPGGLQWHQGVDVAIRAMPRILEHFPTAEFHIYGSGPMEMAWKQLARELGVAEKVKFHPPVPVHEVAQRMAAADLGVVPKRTDSFGNEAYSTKIMEFMALGVPVVASRTRVEQHYFDESVLRFFDSGQPERLAEAVVETLQDSAGTRARVERALAYARANSWQTRQADYLRLVDRLCPPCIR